MTTPGFGKAKVGGGGNFTKNFRLKDGPQSYRLLPPMKSCAETGEWAVYMGTHFGYKGVNDRDPSKPFHRTFKCIEDVDFRTKMVLQDCPECDLIEQQTAALKSIEAATKDEDGNDLTSEQIAELAEPYKAWKKEHNCDRKWHINVKNAAGEFGVLQISHKTKKKLEARIQSLLADDQIDAFDFEQGAWFKFTRTGKGIDTDDTVDVEYESVRENGKTMKMVKTAPMTVAEAEQALKECPDLRTNVRDVTYEQIKLLVGCSGDPVEVDEILAMGQKKEASPAAAKATVKAASAPKPAVVAPKAEPKAEPVQEVAAEEDDEEAALAAQMAALKAKKAAAKAAASPAATVASPTPASTPTAEVADQFGLDREKFMSRFKK